MSDYYQPTSLLSLQLCNASSPLTVEVISAFTPFTMAQVLLVKDNSVSFLKSSFILKVYDPRFYSHRHECKDRQRPWSSSAEAAAAAKRGSKGRNIEFEPHQWPGEDDKEGWEEWYYQNAEMQYHAEVSAYARLTPLQGEGVARCYGTGTLLNLSDRAVSPHFLLLEYIPDALKLDAIDPKSNHVDLALLHSLVETVRQFGLFGVVHTDLNPGNILFSPGKMPTRGVVIDFGESGVREEEDEEEWREIVDQNADVYWVKKRLENQLGVKLSGIRFMHSFTHSSGCLTDRTDLEEN
ncbi:hypothetical protein D9758_005525 [Tetrapyrgos nigripes]|uniref:Protein kinase domain-containing protein n=1 Tax=Tetrapyrgos nigripes TaxID=182062 RepID=A0A8H5LPI8_9AGAR|nr:hypothetical protein D9758_005525 [Tetrapyrgos nigripes]